MAGLGQLDLVSAPLTFEGAVHMLRRLAGEELFQPETPDVPIQVLGLLESAQLEFDHLLVLGLTDEAWPRMPRPNPLLPAELQRARGVPRAAADRRVSRRQPLASGMAAGRPARAVQLSLRGRRPCARPEPAAGRVARGDARRTGHRGASRLAPRSIRVEDTGCDRRLDRVCAARGGGVRRWRAVAPGSSGMPVSCLRRPSARRRVAPSSAGRTRRGRPWNAVARGAGLSVVRAFRPASSGRKRGRRTACIDRAMR